MQECAATLSLFPSLFLNIVLTSFFPQHSPLPHFSFTAKQTVKFLWFFFFFPILCLSRQKSIVHKVPNPFYYFCYGQVMHFNIACILVDSSTERGLTWAESSLELKGNKNDLQSVSHEESLNTFKSFSIAKKNREHMMMSFKYIKR